MVKTTFFISKNELLFLYPNKHHHIQKFYILSYHYNFYILLPFNNPYLSIFVNHLHIVSKTIYSSMNIIKHGLINKTPCFLWQKPYDIVLKTMLYRGYVYIFWHTVNSCKYPRCSTHTPRSKFEIPSPLPFHSTPQKITKNTQNEFENEFEKVLIK